MTDCDFLYLICARFDLFYAGGVYLKLRLILGTGLLLGTNLGRVTISCCGYLSSCDPSPQKTTTTTTTPVSYTHLTLPTMAVV